MPIYKFEWRDISRIINILGGLIKLNLKVNSNFASELYILVSCKVMDNKYVE